MILLEPVVAEGEEEAGIEAWVEMAEAGVGVMDELDFEVPGAFGSREEMEARRGLRREIHIRSVSGRDVRGRKHDSSGDESVGRDPLAAGEIPFEDDGLETATVNGAARLDDGVYGHEVGGEFEIASKEIVEMLGGEDAADARADDDELRRRRFAQTCSAADKRLKFPCAFRQRLRRQTLRTRAESAEE